MTIEVAGAERIGELRELWLALHRHHQQVASLQPLVGDEELSWQRRKALYQEAFAGGQGLLVIATRGRGLVGYAMVLIRSGPDDTWPVGERYGELYSLSVIPAERGRGIGSAVFDAVERELARRGIVDLAVAVMTGNTSAIRFYERRGLEPGEVVLYRFGSQAGSEPASLGSA